MNVNHKPRREAVLPDDAFRLAAKARVARWTASSAVRRAFFADLRFPVSVIITPCTTDGTSAWLMRESAQPTTASDCDAVPSEARLTHSSASSWTAERVVCGFWMWTPEAEKCPPTASLRLQPADEQVPCPPASPG